MWSGVLAAFAAFGLWRVLFPGGHGTLEASLGDLDGSPEEIRRLAYDAGLPDDWADFLVAKAWVESRWNPYSARGVQPGAPVWLEKINHGPNDAYSARQAYDRQVQRGVFESSPWPADRYTFGSYGLWQLMPANALASSFEGTQYENLDPWSHFMPSRQMAMAVDYNLGLMKRGSYKADPTWRTIYAGWSAPSNMDKQDTAKVQAALERFGRGLDASGIPRSFMDRAPSTDVPGAVEILQRIGDVP